MRAYKLMLKHSLSLGLIVGLTGCNIPSPEKRTDADTSAATFYSDSFDGEVADTKLVTAFAIPESKTYSMNLCLKDVQFAKPILSHKFSIQEVNQEVTTNAKGCLTWSEDIKYNYLGKSQYVVIERTIQAQGYHKGALKLKIALNPWSHGESLNKAYDISKSKIENLNLDVMSLKNSLERSLWADKAALFTQQSTFENSQYKLTYEFQTVPQILLSKMNGEKTPVDLKEGHFKIQISLLQSMSDQGNEKFYLIARSDDLDTKMKQGLLSQQVTLQVNKNSQRGQLYIGVKLTPINGPEGLLPFQGLYLLGDAKNLTAQSPMLKLQVRSTQKNNFDIDKDLNIQNIKSDELPTAFRTAGLIAEKLKFQFVNIGKETTLEREVTYKVTACLSNGVDSQVLKSEKIKLSGPGITAEHTNKVTDQNGCVEWSETIKHAYFECHHPIQRDVQIQSESLKVSQSIKYFVNPWEPEGRFAWDSRWEKESDQIYKKCEPGQSTGAYLNLTSYKLTNLSLDYSFNNMFNLSISRKVRLELEPMIMTPGSIQDGRNRVDFMRNGTYLLRFAVVKNREYIKDPSLIVWTEKLVSVVSGRILTDFTLTTNEVSSLVTTNDVLIEIATVQENNLTQTPDGELVLIDKTQNLESIVVKNSALISPTFTGQISFKEKSTSQALVPFTKSAIKDILINNYTEIQNGPSVILGLLPSQTTLKSTLNEDLEKINTPELLAKKSNSLFFNIKKTNAEFENFRKFLGIDPRSVVRTRPYTPRSPISHHLVTPNEPLEISRLRNEIYAEKVSPYFAQRLCSYWFNSLLKNSLHPQTANHIIQNCIKSVKSDAKQFFQFDSVWHVDQVGKTELKQGLTTNLSISSNYNTRRSYSQTDSQSLAANIGLKVPLNEFLGLAFSASTQMQWADARSQDQSTSSTETIPLEIQEKQLSVQINSHEKCLMIHLNPKIYTDDNSNAFWWTSSTPQIHKYLNSNMSVTEKMNQLSKGVMICSGEKIQKPVTQVESIYIISQDTSMNGTSDGGDLRNNLFLLSIRGAGDYERFLNTVKSQLQIPTSSAPTESQFKFMTTNLHKIFKSVPTYPGFFVKPQNN